MTDIYELILRTPDGREQRMAAWITGERVKQNIIAAARRNGLEVEMREFNENENEKLRRTRL